MRKADLEVGVAYATKWDGKVTVVDTHPLNVQGYGRTGRTTKVQVRREDDGRHHPASSHRLGELFLLSPQTILRRWDDPEEVAARERRAELDRRSDRARELLAILGFTVAQPGRVRDDPEPESWVEGTWKGRKVAITLDAFLANFDVPDPYAVASELRSQHTWAAEQAREQADRPVNPYVQDLA